MPCDAEVPCGEAPAPRRSGCKGGAKAPESALERRLRDATEPVTSDETEQITVNGETGIFANKSEVISWRSKDGKTVEEYEYFNDPNPERITKRAQNKLKYTQEVQVKFLKPPSPPNPPPIIISREGDSAADAAPPVVLIQEGRKAGNLPDVFLRERPPKPPTPLCAKKVTISGKSQPPPPRKVVIERLPDEPCKPGKVTIERWLGYGRQRRQVIFEKADDACPPENPRNLIIEWEAGEVEIEKKYVCLGVEEADPEEYLRQYSDFADPSELDTGDCQPDGVLAVDAGEPEVPELYGELEALREVDLDANGLSEYRPQLQ